MLPSVALTGYFRYFVTEQAYRDQNVFQTESQTEEYLVTSSLHHIFNCGSYSYVQLTDIETTCRFFLTEGPRGNLRIASYWFERFIERR